MLEHYIPTPQIAHAMAQSVLPWRYRPPPPKPTQLPPADLPAPPAYTPSLAIPFRMSNPPPLPTRSPTPTASSSMAMAPTPQGPRNKRPYRAYPDGSTLPPAKRIQVASYSGSPPPRSAFAGILHPPTQGPAQPFLNVYYGRSSNNKAECLGILAALTHAPLDADLTIGTDSEVAINGWHLQAAVQTTRNRQQRRARTVRRTTRLENRAVWKAIRAWSERRTGSTTIFKVAAHQPSDKSPHCLGNNTADHLANIARTTLVPSPSPDALYEFLQWEDAFVALQAGSLVEGDLRAQIAQHQHTTWLNTWTATRSQGALRRDGLTVAITRTAALLRAASGKLKRLLWRCWTATLFSPTYHTDGSAPTPPPPCPHCPEVINMSIRHLFVDCPFLAPTRARRDRLLKAALLQLAHRKPLPTLSLNAATQLATELTPIFQTLRPNIGLLPSSFEEIIRRHCAGTKDTETSANEVWQILITQTRSRIWEVFHAHAHVHIPHLPEEDAATASAD